VIAAEGVTGVDPSGPADAELVAETIRRFDDVGPGRGGGKELIL
jgi:hypothetical protein